MEKKKIGFIGAGNMGYPLLCGAVKCFGADQALFRCAFEEENERVAKKTGVECATSLHDLVSRSSCVVLAIKPQFFEEVLSEISEDVFEGQIFISLAPGITTNYLSEKLGPKAKIIRTMPNTPAQVLEGMTAICYGDSKFSDEEKQLATNLFETVGRTVELPEKLMDASIVANGSSPAFMYMMIEALADGAVKYGIPRNLAYEMVAQTMIGSAKMLLETKEHPGKLKDNVCSPAGTTIAGVAALEEYGFRNAVIKACDACYEKAVSMKK